MNSVFQPITKGISFKLSITLSEELEHSLLDINESSFGDEKLGIDLLLLCNRLLPALRFYLKLQWSLPVSSSLALK